MRGKHFASDQGGIATAPQCAGRRGHRLVGDARRLRKGSTGARTGRRLEQPDAELAAAVIAVDQQFSDTSVGLFRELFPEESAADPDLPVTAVATLFTFLNGLALSNLVPGCMPIAADDLLAVFKSLIATAMPDHTEGTT